jgi:hypothetical protein
MRLINHASGFNRDVANSPARPACTLGGRYPHHCRESLLKEQACQRPSNILAFRTRLFFRKEKSFNKNHKIFIPLLPNPCHA